MKNPCLLTIATLSMILMVATAMTAGAESAPQNQTVITGRVLGLDGAPATGVRVVAQTAEGVDASSFAAISETDRTGHYRLENLPPGRYYIRAGLIDFPTYYPGSATLTGASTVAVTAAGPLLADLDFKLTQPNGYTVKGRITPVPNPAAIARGNLTVTMSPRNITPVLNSDGSFEFLKVPPGTYSLRMSPNSGTAAINVTVNDRDVTGLEIKGPIVVVGTVVVEGGGGLPLDAWMSARGTAMDAPIPIRVQTTSTPPARGGSFFVRADGLFALALEGTETRISVAGMPFGYYTKSVSYGELDLLREPLRPGASTQEIRMTLTTTPPDPAKPGVRVAGKVSGVIPGQGAKPLGVSMVGAAPEMRTGEVQLRPDGSFEFLKVPTGTYTLRTVGSSGSTARVTVVDSDILDVELQLTQTPPR